MLAGRKRDSFVWEWFEYDAATNKSICTVTDSSSQKRCNTKLSGKNTSILVAHLRRCHEDVHLKYIEKDNSRKQESRGIKRCKTEDGPKVQTITDCYQRHIVACGTESPEYKKRCHSVMDVIISTGYPTSLLDQPSFRNLMITLDPKFKPPGRFLNQILLLLLYFNRNLQSCLLSAHIMVMTSMTCHLSLSYY